MVGCKLPSSESVETIDQGPVVGPVPHAVVSIDPANADTLVYEYEDTQEPALSYVVVLLSRINNCKIQEVRPAVDEDVNRSGEADF